RHRHLVMADAFEHGIAAERPNDFVDGKTYLSPAKSSLYELPFFRFAAFGLLSQRKQFLLELCAGVVYCVSHLHRRALCADAGKRKINCGVGRLHTNLALRYIQSPRGYDAEQIVRSLTRLWGVVLNRHNALDIHRCQRISAAATLRTMAQTECHASPPHPWRACGLRLAGGLEIRLSIPTDSRDCLFHQIKKIGVHRRRAPG